MKILVTGGEGLLGSEFGRLGDQDPGLAADTRGLEVVSVGRGTLDVTDPARTRELILRVAPDWVVHCAAYTAVDRAEEEPDEAMRVNRGGTVNVSEAVGAVAGGCGLVYLSSDYVFDGGAEAPYPPDAPVAPLSAYARSKRAGEEVALHAGGAVVRTGWLYGKGGRNFVDSILARAERGDRLRVVDDQRGRPTWTRNAARVIVDLLVSADADAEGGLAGVWHVADAGEATWLELAREAVRLRGLAVDVEGVSTAAWGAPAPRPAYSALDLRATEKRLGRPMMEWTEALSHYLGGSG